MYYPKMTCLQSLFSVGICKVIPPLGWKINEVGIDTYGDVIIPNAIAQYISGKRGG